MTGLPAQADPLAGLHGLVLPAPPGWWPPAPGWWLVLIGLVLLIAAAIVCWRRYQGRAVIREQARAVGAGIQQLQALADAGDLRRYATQADQLIRQLAKLRFGVDAVSLSGPAWQQWLDDHAPDECKSADWQCLAEHRYRRELPAVDLQALHRQCRQWLEHNTPC